ncbi:MAG: penicillin-binding protein 2 [Gaiellales bacterium]|nr:penicillin-binding protein 2 [Gaiellales bacterium]
MRNRRLLITAVLLLLCVTGLLARAFYLQVVLAAEYTERAEEQHIEVQTVSVKRASILDREGAELALSVSVPSICADPTQLEDPAAAAAAVAPLTGVNQAELLELFSSDEHFCFVGRKVAAEVGEKVAALSLPGVYQITEEKRVYPQGPLAPQLLGFVGTENKGLAGLELTYEERLQGTEGSRRVLVDEKGRGLEVLSEEAPRQADALTLTLDKDIQYAVEQILAEVVESEGAKRASAIVMDPDDGGILALATTPSFDTNEYANAPQDAQRNVLVTDQYEPGSTFKVVLMAAALENGLVTPDSSFTLPAELPVKDVVIREAHEDVPYQRVMTTTDILAQSSNVGTVTIALDLGREKLVDMIQKFGFTCRTGIDLPGEVAGTMLPLEQWNWGTAASVPIGQGISVTAIQMIAAYAAIANDGILMQPHLSQEARPGMGVEVMSQTVARQLRDMLRKVVEEGTGTSAKLAGYTVAGKTGTAQKVEENSAVYSQDKYVASFVGMIPADDPEIVVLAIVDEPQEAYFGSEVAAPVFARIADFTVKHLGIVPDSAD